MSPSPERVINATAPIRICDIGGWTDTWFAQHGKVLNIAVRPHVHVQVRACRAAASLAERPSVDASCDPLIDATVRHMEILPADSLQIQIVSDAPPGSSTGTSAALCVALVGALARLTGRTMTPTQVARTAHAVETEELRQQSGVQDQIAAAFGGINFIDIGPYPATNMTQLELVEPLASEFEGRLSLVYLGKAHRSSAVHEMVIRKLADVGHDSPTLSLLRTAALRSRDALLRGDLVAFGDAMVANTEAQSELHPALVSPLHQQIIDIARSFGAWGWKVNGAGGDGGSVTVLHGPSLANQAEAIKTIARTDADFKFIPISLSRSGLRVWDSPRPLRTQTASDP